MQCIKNDEDDDCHFIDMQEEAVGPALAPAAALPAPLPDAPVRGRGRPRGRGRGRGRGAALGAGPAAPEAAAAGRNAAAWAAVNEILPFAVPAFVGTPGPTGFGERMSARNPDELPRLCTTKLFFVQKFIDSTFVECVLKCTNEYVAGMEGRPRPAWHPPRAHWPPKWRSKWKPLTEAVFWRWLGFLMWCGLHHTANEAELFSPHWIWERPGVKLFFTADEHKQIKS